MPRKQKKYHFIYKTTCLLNQKYYIGLHSTDDLEDGYIGSGKRLWYSIRKHGKENHKFEILEMLETRKSLKDREKELVNEERLQDPMCMNLQIGGEGGNNYFINGKPGISTYNSIRNKERNKKHNATVKPFLGKTHSDETKKKISERVKEALRKKKLGVT